MKMCKGPVDFFLASDQTELIEPTSTPQEEPRLQVPRIFLDETISAMNETVHLRPSASVFNLDEVGISQWEDRKSKLGGSVPRGVEFGNFRFSDTAETGEANSSETE
jgi:hypothetical protein